MVMPKLPPGKKRSVAIYILLRPSEVEALDAVVQKDGWRSRASCIRGAFLRLYRKRFPKELADD